jgi:ribosome-associated protein
MIGIEDKQEKSKSQIKRELLALQELGRELLDLSGKNLYQVPVSVALREAVLAAKHFKKEALRRQLQLIGALMRDEDAEAIRQALATLRQPLQREVQVFHEIESWRDALLAGDAGLLEKLCHRYPDIDRQHVRRLVRNAGKEQKLNKPPRAARDLFRYLKELQAK